MNRGAFRDAGAAIERVAVLEQEKDELESEVAALRRRVASLEADGANEGEAARELSRVRVQLAAERAERKAAVTALAPLTRELKSAEAALRQARSDRELAVAELERIERVLVSAKLEIEHLQRELAAARADLSVTGAQVETITKVPENLDAYMKRVEEERNDLLDEVRRLRAQSVAVPRPSFVQRLFGRRR